MKSLNGQIEKYLKGKMFGKELVDFEKLISEDEFLADAIDGYKKTQASTDDLKTISVRFKRNNKNRKWIYAAVYSGVAAVVIVVAAYMLTSKDNKILKSNFFSGIISDTINIYDTSVYEKFRIDKDPELFFDDTIDHMGIEKAVEKKNYVTELREIAHEPTYIPESIQPLYINKSMIIENEVKNENIEHYYRFRSNHWYMYIDGFKIVDYSSEKDKCSNSYFNLLSGNSNYNNCAYIVFMEQTIEKLKNKKYYEVIDDLNIILETYPNDPNAIFYKGICYYELNKNKQSMKFFDRTLKNEVNTFHEDAKWYKSLIYKREKEYEIAMKVLEEIIDEKGYYGVQAEKELDDIYKYYLNE